MKPQNILFFADRLPPLIGGMEIHAKYFIEYFTYHPRFPLSGVVTKNSQSQDCLLLKEGKFPQNIENLPKLFDPTFIFFNSGRWIEELKQIRKMFPKAIFIYRTGGNELLKAPLTYTKILDHSLRQAYWTKNLNYSINLLITNSAYTEKRFRDLGIICPFARCVGGVNIEALKESKSFTQNSVIIFCAARFVPYKNHFLLLYILRELIARGYKFQVRLAGDGPLLTKIKKQVIQDNLTEVVKFLGVLDNQETCHEIAQANIYMQLSTDYITKVPGGSYLHSEGMGRSILEALSAGTFVVAGRSGALSEVVTQDRGILLDFDNLNQTTNEVEQVIKNPPARLPCIEDFSWTNIFKHYEELLENVR